MRARAHGATFERVRRRHGAQGPAAPAHGGHAEPLPYRHSSGTEATNDTACAGRRSRTRPADRAADGHGRTRPRAGVADPAAPAPGNPARNGPNRRCTPDSSRAEAIYDTAAPPGPPTPPRTAPVAGFVPCGGDV